MNIYILAEISVLASLLRKNLCIHGSEAQGCFPGLLPNQEKVNNNKKD